MKKICTVGLFLLSTLAPVARTQVGRCHFNGLDSKIWIFNTEFGGLVEYPNFRAPGGNVDGDAFWKVIPSELIVRTSNVCAPTHATIAINMSNWAPGAPIFIYRCEVRYAIRDASGNLVPDFSRRFIVNQNRAETAAYARDGNYLYRQGGTTSGLTDIDPRQELGIAFVLYAPPGQTPTSPNVQRGIHSKGERYGKAPQSSFSGVRDGRTGQLSLLVPPLVPEAAEFQFAMGFLDAMVSVSATTSGGGSQPWEMNTGVGAYYNDLASRGGRMRLYVEEDGFSGGPSGPTGALVVPLLSLGRGQRRFPLPVLTCEISIDPLNPLAVLPITWGWIPSLDRRDAYTNFADAFAYTPWIQIPQSLDLKDVRLHFEVLSIVLQGSYPGVRSTTNSLEVTLR